MMLAIEPFRHGREYEVRLDWLFANVDPWDFPSCWDCDMHADLDTEGECIEYVFDSLPRLVQWTYLLDYKRLDEQYPDVKLSLQLFGFVKPLTLRVRRNGSIETMGDGHHRLAAAEELGIPTVRIRAASSTSRRDAVADDSGSESSEGWNIEQAIKEGVYCARVEGA